MEILNLVTPQKSQIDFEIKTFPDGETQIVIHKLNHKVDYVLIICRITSERDLFVLCQVGDILRRHGIRFQVRILYLMGMRMDRVMDFDRPFTLQIVAEIINALRAKNIEILTPHSNRTLDLIQGAVELKYNLPFNVDDYQIVLPDSGAFIRDGKNYDNPICCTKVRDLETGNLSGFAITNPEAIEGRPLMIIDDLCDGGGTFVGIANEFYRIDPTFQLNIFVTHMVNPRGIVNLAGNYKQVYFTNSYKDWNDIPSNCEIVDASIIE